MSNKLSVVLAISSLFIGFITGILWDTFRDESKDVELERLEQESRLMQQISEARYNVSMLTLLEKKNYKKIEELQLYLLDRHYDNLVSVQSTRNQIGYENTPEWKSKTDVEKKLFDIKSFLVDAKKYENKLPSRNFPRKPSYPIEKATADLLRNGNQSFAAFRDHLKKYLYRKWLDYGQFQTFISYESEEFDPSPGPEIIFFFYKDRLYAVLHKEEVPFNSFVRNIEMSGYKVSYLFRRDGKLEKDFDAHYGNIIANAD